MQQFRGNIFHPTTASLHLRITATSSSSSSFSLDVAAGRCSVGERVHSLKTFHGIHSNALRQSAMRGSDARTRVKRWQIFLSFSVRRDDEPRLSRSVLRVSSLSSVFGRAFPRGTFSFSFFFSLLSLFLFFSIFFSQDSPCNEIAKREVTLPDTGSSRHFNLAFRADRNSLLPLLPVSLRI